MAPNYEEVVNTELHQFWGWSYTGFVNKLFEVTPIQNEDVILDIATGTGVIPNRLVLDGFVDHQIHGLDITMSMLEHAKLRFGNNHTKNHIALVCASAMEIPYRNESFSLVICGLATHHMSVEQLLVEGQRILRHDGRLSIIDAGGSFYWNIPGAKLLLRLAAFIYFSMTESYSRAWAEASAVSNVRTTEEWYSILSETGFKSIEILKLKSKYAWISAPLIIKAVKS